MRADIACARASSAVRIESALQINRGRATASINTTTFACDHCRHRRDVPSVVALDISASLPVNCSGPSPRGMMILSTKPRSVSRACSSSPPSMAAISPGLALSEVLSHTRVESWDPRLVGRRRELRLEGVDPVFQLLQLRLNRSTATH
jgi:hypothetical protein